LIITPTYDGLVSDSDAAAYLAAVQAADGQLLEPATRQAINAFVVGCKADGIWTAIKASCILAGARTLAGALVPLVGTAPTNFNFVSGDYNRKTGLMGNGSTKYLNSNRNNNTDPQDSHHLAVFVSQAATSGPSIYPTYIGSGSSFAGASVFGRLNNNGNIYTRSRSGLASLTILGSTTGFLSISRNAASLYTTRANATPATVTQSSATPRSVSNGVFRDLDSPLDTTANARLAFYSIGESLDLALLDARVTALITAISTAF
jgi:hypothetical protein